MSGTFEKATPLTLGFQGSHVTFVNRGDECVARFDGRSHAQDAATYIRAVNSRDDIIEVLDAITSYAESALAQFSNGRGALDISGFHSLIKASRAALSATSEGE